MSTINVSKQNLKTAFDILDVEDFNERIIGAYNDGSAELGLPADDSTARSLIPIGTGQLRDFSYIAPNIPKLNAENCVGCMECVTQCPDTAILGKAIPEQDLNKKLSDADDFTASHFANTKKFYDTPKKQGKEPAKFGIFIDPTKCKGCAECVDAC
ncbi:MAG TPA: 4Fe-4S binding protein, partial [SAR324 cluster bacterium]|nr:4Fe-4S binding protein [Candidatus Neomarinimicrobiota bacterium]HJO43725.1 4Fe-4S binding protein [SAR324 cluster bacterium]